MKIASISPSKASHSHSLGHIFFWTVSYIKIPANCFQPPTCHLETPWTRRITAQLSYTWPQEGTRKKKKNHQKIDHGCKFYRAKHGNSEEIQGESSKQLRNTTLPRKAKDVNGGSWFYFPVTLFQPFPQTPRKPVSKAMGVFFMSLAPQKTSNWSPKWTTKINQLNSLQFKRSHYERI